MDTVWVRWLNTTPIPTNTVPMQGMGTYHTHRGVVITQHGITHHFSMELLSTSKSALIPYLNTDSPFVHGFPSFTLQSSSNSLCRTAICHNPFPMLSLIHSPPPSLSQVHSPKDPSSFIDCF